MHASQDEEQGEMVLAWEVDLLESSPCSLTGSLKDKVHPVSEPPQFPLVPKKQL